MDRGRGDSRGIQSIEVGGRILAALAAATGPLALKDLARAADMTAAKAHPYLASFARIGLVEQESATGAYELGPMAVQLGMAALLRLNPVRMAIAAAGPLSRALGHTVAVAVWGSHGPTIIHIEDSPRAIHVNMRAGTVMSLIGTATGRAFAAWLPEATVDEFLKQGRDGVGDVRGQKMSRHIFEELIARTRTDGVARTVDAPIPGISALSAPVFMHTGSLALVITALGPSAGFDAGATGAIALSLRAAAQELSARLGFRTVT
ncbi:MAG: IclR family transcriptional regulator [Beijerinckiaceae bacterium]